MTGKYVVVFLSMVTLATLSCGLATPASNTPTPAPVQVTVPAPTVAVPNLTLDQLQTAQYQIGGRDDHAVVQLTDGKYQHGTDTTTLDFAYVGLTQFASVGDITGDGVDEIAAIFIESYGGTGNFAFLTIYSNINGMPVFLTSTMIDDRPMINSLSIENGEVYLDAIVHGSQDGGCCPTLATTRRYALVNNTLRIVNYTTATPEGAQRTIEITTPQNATEVVGNVQISGTVSIAPFENNLSYFIYSEAGEQLAAGPMPVNAPDFGAPGTFDANIALTGIPSGTVVYLEIQDISAADGSWLAMDAVKLSVK